MLVMGDRVVACDDGRAPLGLDFRESGFPARRRAFAGDVEFFDLRGRTVIPGITDSHVHFLWWAFNQRRADLTAAGSEEAAVAALQKHAPGPASGEWLVGFGWSHNAWPGATLPSLRSLDAAFPRNPVFLNSKCGHLGWVNSAALAAAGITPDTADPAGGEIERTKINGRLQLTGIVKESAVSIVESRIPEWRESDWYRALDDGQRLAHSFGLTGMQTPEDLDTWDFLQRAHAGKCLTMRVNFWIPVAALEHLCELRVRDGYGDSRLRISAVKLFTDGSLGGRTALMYEPYEGEATNTGICVTEKEELIEKTLQANHAGLSMAVHAIGDRSIDYVLSAFEKSVGELAKKSTSGAGVIRNRIEHLQVFAERDLPRLRKLKPIASMQPVHLCADMGPADRYWGARSRFAYAFRALADAGCPLAFGSDAPVESINPFYGMYAAATRRNLQGEPINGWYPEERISREAALRAYTAAPAAASGQSHELGKLSPGKLADFVVLPRDPLKCSEEELRDMKPVATYSGGECVFSSVEELC